MCKNNPVISIIVAVYNGERTLQRCINSVFNQTYPHKELIVIDGGSSDRTIDILHANNDKITYWESKPDRGICHAWNKALEHANGDWICFLGADDFLWKDDVLGRVVQQLSKVPSNIRVVYGKVANVTEQGELLQVTGEPWKKIKRWFLQLMVIPHQGVMHHHSLFSVHGKFDESFRITGDYELLLRELKTSDAIFISDIILTGMQRGGVSNEMKFSLLALREAAQARLKNKVKIIPLLWTWSFIKAWVRIVLIKLIGDRYTRFLTDVYRRLTGRPYYWTK